MRRRARSARVAVLRAVSRWQRDALALAGVGCVAVGLASWSPALSWIAVGGFLVLASASGRGREG